MASAREYAEWIVKNQGKRGTPEFDTVAQAYKASRSQEQPQAAAAPQGEATPDPASQFGEDIAGSRPVRFALGAAAPFAGALQLGANVGDKIAAEFGLEPSVGKVINEHISELEKVKQRGMKEAGTEGYDVMGLLGSVLSPAGLSAGKAMTATSLPGKVGQGAALGAGYGAATPVVGAEGTEDFLKTKALQTAGGAVVGAAVPLALEPLKKLGAYLYHIVEPKLPGGTEAIMRRVLGVLAGENKPGVEKALAEAPVGGLETAGQAAVPAGSAEFSAAAQQLRSLRPSQYESIEAAQEAQRLAQIRSVGGSQLPPAQALPGAEAVRSQAAGKLYSEAFAKSIKADPSLQRLSKNPFFQQALKNASDLSEAQGITPDTLSAANMTQYLHNVKLALDDMLRGTSKTTLAASERRAAVNVKRALVNWIGEKNPAYEAARSAYARDSEAVNKLSVAKFLEERFLKPGTAEERPGLLLQSMRDAEKTLERATSLKGPRTLGETIGPRGEQALETVEADLVRNARLEALAKAGGSRAREILGDLETRPPHVPILWRPATIGQAVLRRLEGLGSRKTLEELSKRMENPQEILRLLREAPPSVRQELLKEAASLARNQGAIGAPSIMFAQEQ